MSPPLHDDLNIDSINLFSNLADYNAALFNAIARHDESVTNDLLYNFKVSDYGAIRIIPRRKVSHA